MPLGTDPGQQAGGPPPGVILGDPVPAPQPPSGLPPGVTLGAPVPAPQTAPNPLTANPKGEGLYQMKGPGGVVGIPYSNLATARQQGYNFATPDEMNRYVKDFRATGRPLRVGTDFAAPEALGAVDANDIIKGALKTAAQVPVTVAGWLDSLDPAPKSLTDTEGAASHLQDTVKKGLNKVAPGITNPVHGGAQMTGLIGEQIGEWLFGEGEVREAFEALPLSQRLKKIAETAKFLEEHKVIAKAVSIGLKNGAAGLGVAGQAMLHGSSPADAGKAGLEAGAGGAVLEGAAAGAGRLVDHLRPNVETIAGEEVPVLKSQQFGEKPNGEVERPSAAQAVSATTENSPSVTSSQRAAAKRTVTQEAQRATQTNLDKMNTMRGLTDDADVPALVQRVGDFGESAEALHAAAKDAYQRIDDVTDGEFSRARDTLKKAQSDVWRTTGDAHYRALKDESEAQRRLQEIFEEHDDDIRPEDKAAADFAYRTGFTLRDIDKAYEPVFDVTRQFNKDTGAYRGFDGNKANARFKALLERNPQIEQVLGREGINNLQTINNLNRTMADRARFGETISNTAKYLNTHWGSRVAASLAAGAGYKEGGTVGAAAGAGTYYATRLLLHTIATNPKFAENLAYGLRYGANADRLAPILGQMVLEDQREREKAAPSPAQDDSK